MHDTYHVEVVLGGDVVDGGHSILSKVHKMDHLNVSVGFIGFLICHVDQHVLEHLANLGRSVQVSLEEALALLVPHLQHVLVAHQLS